MYPIFHQLSIHYLHSLQLTNSTKKSSATLKTTLTPAKITKVEIKVTTINGTGGTYPLITPLKTIPSGIATTHPFPTLTIVDAMKLESSPRSSGEYTFVSGEVANHADTNGKAVIKMAIMSNEPSEL